MNTHTVPSASSRPRDPATDQDIAMVRALAAGDRAALERLIRSIDLFSEAEKEVALEVLDTYLERPGADYFALVASGPDGRLLGYACYGATPCTEGTWDLYWIAVDGPTRGQGIGSRLMDVVEERIAKTGARLLLIETSSRAEYGPTRAFYERRGYDIVARVADFYAPGDDRVIFARSLQHA